MKNPFRLSAFCALLLVLSFGCSTSGPDVLSDSAPARAAESFTFAFLSDTHIVTTDVAAKNGDRAARFRAALDIVHGRDDVDFILLGGDLVENAGAVDQFDAFDTTMKTTLPVYPIAGNHDIGKTPSLAHLALWNSRGYGRGDSKRDYYGFLHKNAAFYVIDTFVCESTDPAVAAIADDQLREMDAFFALHASWPHRIVCGHAPLFIQSADEANEYFNIPAAYRSRVIDVMKRHGVSVYLSGHRHGDYTTRDPISGITVMTQGSLAFAIGEGQRLGFSLIVVNQDGITKEFIPVVDPPSR
jgi:predicted MPP superfamily phosphohydrolase